MKKLYFLLLGLVLCLSVNAQVINFPDVNFKNKLLSSNSTNQIAKNLDGNYFKIDANLNGEIEVIEAIQVSYLDISVSSIQSVVGIQNFISLRNLNISNYDSVNYNQLTQLNLNGLINLETLNCSKNYLLNSLNLTGCSNLISLNCENTNIGTLNLDGFNQITTLNCAGSYLTSLSLVGLSNLTTLNCCCNLLTFLDLSSCTNLVTAVCNGSNLTTVNVTGLSYLQSLEIHLNDLTALDLTSCTNLTYLNCWGNQLTSLDLSGLSNLVYLNSWQNDLNSLQLEGCFNLQEIDCSENNLTSIDLTGLINLEILNCRFNNLDSLDVSLQEGLTQLNCSFNQITSIDISNNHLLDVLMLHDNNMSFMNIKNGKSIYTGGIYNNPNLTYVCCDDFEISFVEDSFVDQDVNINSYCTFFPGGNYYTIAGDCKIDIDTNGCDSNDSGFNLMNFSITNGIESGNIFTNLSGHYEIGVYDGIYTIIPIFENPSYFSISPTSLAVDFPTQGEVFNQNFCITPNGSHNDLEATILPLDPARPGFNATYKVVCKNKGTTTLSGSITFEFEDDKMDVISSIPVFSSQSTGLLTYDYTNLQPLETREILLTLNINSPQESPAVNIGDQLNFTVIINPLSGDEFLFDNTSSLKQTVVGSYDPNDKTCVEGNIVGPEMIGQYVHYVIRFENTGTFPAENVVVKDMIDLTKFDLSTLIPTSSSHSFVTRIAADGKVEFIFENIQLPFDDANNDGYVAFKIKTLPSLAIGDTFSNNANIYFDYNFPIETNTATTAIQVLGNSDFNLSDYVTLYPNPVKNVLNVSVKEMISITSINIYNSLGQLVLASTNPEGSVDVSSLKSGNYFIKLISDKGVSISQFIKE
ncbi:MAG: T9SS type A sorting domain-containing protein [Flavobacteriales bacterium]|nr:T9SS type A sorting domain-containing protein [Flavobacteriales bacterium]